MRGEYRQRPWYTFGEGQRKLRVIHDHDDPEGYCRVVDAETGETIDGVQGVSVIRTDRTPVKATITLKVIIETTLVDASERPFVEGEIVDETPRLSRAPLFFIDAPKEPVS